MSRNPAPDDRPVTLTIAGSDSGGGAGIQADLKSQEAHGTFATSVVTAVTAQNTQGVESSFVLPTAEIEQQLTAILDDFELAAAKTGMLATSSVIDLVTEYAADFDFPLVVDPVMVAASGDRLLDQAAETAYENLIAHASLVTPNTDETAVLTGIEVTDVETATQAGEAILELGADAALIKGGHVPSDAIHDVLVTPSEIDVFSHPRVETDATHGSGCTLASTITAKLAHEASLATAVESATAFMERAVRYPLDVGQGPGSVHHLVALREQASRHVLIEQVADIVDTIVRADVRALVPEVGMNIVGATPYAEHPGETAAVEGRIARTLSGVKPTGGVRCGASSHVARFLLAMREHDPSLQFAMNCRFNSAIEDALGSLDGPVVEIDRTREPDPDEEGETMPWAASRAFEEAAGTPAAVFDRGAIGKEAMTRVLAPDQETASTRLRQLAEATPA